jgi:hypothetical protein
LLAKDPSRPEGCDQVEPDWGQVSLVGVSFPLSGVAEWLAGRASCEDSADLSDSSQSCCVSPSTKPSKKMPLVVFFDFIWVYLCNAALVHVSIGYMSGAD